MQTFVVLVLDTDEDAWETRDEAARQPTYDTDGRFVALLAERGGRVVGGQELTHSREGRVVTDGPYAESVEQLSGFYVVEADSIDDVAEAAGPMVSAHARIEIRPVAGS